VLRIIAISPLLALPAQFAGLLLSPRRAGDIDRLLQQRQANAEPTLVTYILLSLKAETHEPLSANTTRHEPT